MLVVGPSVRHTGAGDVSAFEDEHPGTNHQPSPTGAGSFVAAAEQPRDGFEPSYVTSDGEFLVFAALGRTNEDGVVGEPRGASHNEVYRYDATDGRVMCVSCGVGVAPAESETIVPKVITPLETQDGIPSLIQMSDDGREVFFQTTAQLVPQDTNRASIEVSSVSGRPGLDVYEWVAEGMHGCGLGQGPTRPVATAR